MPISGLNNELLDAIIISVGGLWAVLLGYKRFRTGTVPRRSLEEIGILSYVNNVRWLRRQPSQSKLTDENVRIYGLIEMLIGTVLLACGLFMVIRHLVSGT
jgi:hypothetical protein